jgi:ABC-type dipeptide/oligopeptide/nickel transport system permease subunit
MAATDVSAAVGAATAEWSAEWRRPSRLASLGRTARRNPVGVVAAIIVFAFVAIGVTQVFADYFLDTTIAPEDPREIHAERQLQGPSLDHPLGTNRSGNDMLSRIIAGTRVSFLIGSMALFLGFVPGSFLGIVSGYYQRWIACYVQPRS